MELAREMGVKLLAQIPVDESICDGGDGGEPVALKDTATGMAFHHLAREVIRAVDSRNSELPPTVKVDISKH